MKRFLAILICLMLAASTCCAYAEESTTDLTIAVGSQFTTLDPALNTETINAYAVAHMYEGLFAQDENSNAVNALCASYEVSEDGLVYTFKMIEDATWSDGVPVTANDFVYSYLRALSYGADNSWVINDMMNYVAGAKEYNARALEMGEAFDCTVEDASGVGFKALDDYTLEITLCKPFPYLIKAMASMVWLPVRQDFAPQHESRWAFEGGYPTNGAYTLVSCNENESCVLTKSATYYKADEVTVDNINMIVMPDAAAQAFAYQTGEVDIALAVSSETALTYEGTENLWLAPQCSNYFLLINAGETGPEWAKDVNVRRALAMAIDKDALVEVLGGATLFPPLNGYVPTGVGGVSGDFRAEGDADGYTLKYDPEEAKRLLAEAGYDESNPLEIVYKYSNNSMHGDVATMLQAMWQAVGVTVTFDAVESGVFYDQTDNGEFEICRYGYAASNDAMQYLTLWTRGNQVTAAVDDPAYDEMMDAAASLTDPAEYYTALHAAEDYLCDQNAYVIPLFNYTTPVLLQSGITGYRACGGQIFFSHITKG